jgi:uncharacterized membrane protein YqgA involved in biofilm formation
MVSVPPYCGTPSESHHFAPAVGVVGVTAVDDVSVVVSIAVVVGLVVGVVVGVVFVLQDASTRDNTIRQDKINHKNLLFTFSSFFLEATIISMCLLNFIKKFIRPSKYLLLLKTVSPVHH